MRFRCWKKCEVLLFIPLSRLRLSIESTSPLDNYVRSWIFLLRSSSTPALPWANSTRGKINLRSFEATGVCRVGFIWGRTGLASSAPGFCPAPFASTGGRMEFALGVLGEEGLRRGLSRSSPLELADDSYSVSLLVPREKAGNGPSWSVLE